MSTPSSQLVDLASQLVLAMVDCQKQTLQITTRESSKKKEKDIKQLPTNY